MNPMPPTPTSPMKRRARRPWWIVHLTIVVALHTILLPVLSHQHVVSSLLGSHASELGNLTLAVLFVLCRLIAVLYLPGMVLAHLGRAWFDRRFPEPSVLR